MKNRIRSKRIASGRESHAGEALWSGLLCGHGHEHEHETEGRGGTYMAQMGEELAAAHVVCAHTYPTGNVLYFIRIFSYTN